ncbi:MAG: tyrosine-type recombinase/integrase [Blastocatellales bacterium]
MKSATGYVFYDEKRKRWIARFAPVDKETGKQKEFKRYCLTKTEARKKLQELKTKYEKGGVKSVNADKSSFAFLAEKFKKEKLIEAVYVGEKKIAGRRELSGPEAWRKQLLFYFGSAKLNEITKGKIEQFKLWLSKLPTRSQILEKETGKLEVVPNPKGKQRSVEAINRPVEMLRVMLNYAVDERMISPEQNPFFHKSARTLIERAAETSRERFPTFGEELALINYCDRPGPRGNAHLRAVLIVAADTGLRENELFTLGKKDVDFSFGVINVRAINAKTNRPRPIPMTRRVSEELARLNETSQGELIFGGLKEVKRSFNTACRTIKVTDLHKHDFRHAFVSRSILAGIPPAVALKASGHASDEWKRYLNMTPDQLQNLFKPLEGQDAEEVKNYGLEILRQLREAMGYTDIANLIAGLDSRGQAVQIGAALSASHSV